MLASEKEGDDNSTERQVSSCTQDLILQAWSSLESLVSGSRFSNETADEVTRARQRREELEAMDPHNDGSVALDVTNNG